MGTFTICTIAEYEKIRSKALSAVKGINPVGWAKKKFGTTKKQVVRRGIRLLFAAFSSSGSFVSGDMAG